MKMDMRANGKGIIPPKMTRKGGRGDDLPNANGVLTPYTSRIGFLGIGSAYDLALRPSALSSFLGDPI